MSTKPAASGHLGASFVLSIVLHGAVALVLALRFVTAPSLDLAGAAPPVDVDVMTVGEKAMGHARRLVPATASAPDPVLASAPRTVNPLPVQPATALVAATAPGGAGDTVSIAEAGVTLTLSRGQYMAWVRRHNPAPAYPRAANEARQTGRVVVELRVHRDGAIEGARVDASSGHSLLDEAALGAIRKWRFPPYTGVVEPLVLKVPFKFELYD